jgi:hypothetical protein
VPQRENEPPGVGQGSQVRLSGGVPSRTRPSSSRDRVPGEVAARESQQSSEFRFGKTLNRRILGSLNDMAYHMSWELERRDGDSVAAAAVLSEMPCRQPNFIVPGEEAFSLLGISSQYDRKRIDQMYFPEFSARWHV